MKRGRAFIGLMVLCALAFSAVTAASASAKGTTAFTCVKEKGSNQETNSHCSSGTPNEKYGHVEFAAGTKTHLETTATSPQVLKGTVAGLAVTLESNEVEVETEPTPTTTSYIQNNAGPPMSVSGTAVIVYKNVEITASPALKERCTIKEMKVTTNPLNFKSSIGETKKTTGIVFEPQEGKVFAKVNFVTNPNPHNEKVCPVAGLEAPVEGTVTGNTSGATLTVSPESSSLTLGGNPATLEGTVTISGVDPAEPKVTNALTLTTVE